MKNFGFLLLILGTFLLVGCSTWELKQRCAATNWFEYGQKSAMNGNYLEVDGFVNSCKGVNVYSHQQIDVGFKSGRERYCTLEQIRQNGKEGIPVNFTFCDNLETPMMVKKHIDGLKDFCIKDSGYRYGLSGKDYAKVCSVDQEKEFLPSYHKGRREYLDSVLSNGKNDVVTMEKREGSLLQSEQSISSEIRTLPQPQECHQISVYDEAAKKETSKTVCEEAWYTRDRRMSLNSSIDTVRSDLHSVRTAILDSQKRIQWANEELKKVPLSFQETLTSAK